MAPSPDPSGDERELEPIDPKSASRAIKRHIERKRATEVRRKEGGEAEEPPPAGPGPEEAAPPAEAASAPEEGALEAAAIRNRDLVRMMEHSTGSLMGEWLQAQLGDDPKEAQQVSRTEMEFLLLKRTLME